MNRCRQVLELLNDYLDDELASDESRAVSRHVQSCQSCRQVEAELLSLRAAASVLPREISPSRDLWPDIAERIQENAGRGIVVSGHPRRGPWHRGAYLAAAAVILTVVTAGLVGLLRQAGPDGERPTESFLEGQETVGLASWRTAEDEFAKARHSLRQALERRRSSLSSETVAVVDENLEIIEEAIDEIRSALEQDPTDADLNQMLIASYKKQIELLQRAHVSAVHQ